MGLEVWLLVMDTTSTPRVAEFARARGEGAYHLVAEGISCAPEEAKPVCAVGRRTWPPPRRPLPWPGDGGARRRSRLRLTHYFGPSSEDPSAHLDLGTHVSPEATGVGRDGPTGTPTLEEEKQARGYRPHWVPREPVLSGCTAEVPRPGAEIHSGQTPPLYGRNGIGKTISGDTLPEFVGCGYPPSLPSPSPHPHKAMGMW